MNVERLMTTDMKTCSPRHFLDCAARIMWENDCGVVPIVDDEGRAVAMLTDRDVCIAAFTQGKALAEIPVSVACSKTLHAVRPTESARAAEELMCTRQVRRLAVTDEAGRLVGVLSINDLARHLDEIGREDLAATLAAISATRRGASREAEEEPATT